MKVGKFIALGCATLLIAAVQPSSVMAQKAAGSPSVKSKAKPVTARQTNARRTTTAPTSTARKPAKKQPSSKKTRSACAGLARNVCGATKQCGWITPKKKVSSNGRKLSAYCRKVAGISKKK